MARERQDLQILALRVEVEELYTEYAHVLDNFELEHGRSFSPTIASTRSSRGRIVSADCRSR